MLTQKQCCRCRETKSTTEYHKNRSRKDGLSPECKDCVKIRRHEYYLQNKKKILQRTSVYQRDNPEKWNPLHAKAIKTYMDRNPLRIKAKNDLNHAVEKGEIVRPIECERCGKEPKETLHGHHKDYTKPFDVIWLCNSCHKMIHRKNSKNNSQDFPNNSQKVEGSK